MTSKQIKKLIYFSGNDREIKKFTHDGRRFKDLNSFKKWFTKDVQTFVLTNSSDDLLGLIWIKPKEHSYSKYKHTFALRIYKPLRGKGYAYDFAQNVFNLLKIKGLWLSTNINNVAALKLYNKLGFKQIGKEDDQIFMELSL